MERLPEFIIAGVQKAGTTSLYDALMQHPGVFPGSWKEIHFFDWHYKMGIGWYKQQFSGAPSYCITGEATGNYIFHPHAPHRIAAHLKETKFIILLRNPVDVAYSQFSHARANRKESEDFFIAIDRIKQQMPHEIERLKNDENYYSFIFDIYSYIERGLYAYQIERWMKAIRDKGRTLILDSSEYFKSPTVVYSEVTEFLNLQRWQPIEFKHLKKRDDDLPSANAGIRQYLREFYKPYNEVLYDLLGKDFGWENK